MSHVNTLNCNNIESDLPIHMINKISPLPTRKQKVAAPRYNIYLTNQCLTLTHHSCCSTRLMNLFTFTLPYAKISQQQKDDPVYPKKTLNQIVNVTDFKP